MNTLAPLETLYEVDGGKDLPLPPSLAALYGRLQFPSRSGSPYVIGNFVSTLDGIVSLDAETSGGEISGLNPHDRMVMGLLRSVADAVIVGAGTLRADPHHLWTADHIYPSLSAEYKQLLANLKKSGPPLNVIVTGSGEIDLDLRVFQSGEAPVLIVTTTNGAHRIRERNLPHLVRVAAVEAASLLGARAILDAVGRARQSDIILIEGGPHLMGNFFAEQCLAELFLTLAPQIAGRDNSTERPGLVAGKIFAPEQPLWSTLIGVKRGGSHLFLRYGLSR